MGFVRSYLGPLAIFVTLSVVTVWIWQQQVSYRSALVANHARDVCAQAARRVEVFVEAHVRMARVFAIRWATHGSRDFSQSRFNDIAGVLVRELPGFHAVELFNADGSPHWRTTGARHEVIDPEVLDASTVANRPVLSPPQTCPTGCVEHFYVAIPLHRGEEFLGHLVVTFLADVLINDGFENRIRSEFDFEIEDQGTVLFRSSPEGPLGSARDSSVSIVFPVLNREWRLAMAPRTAPESPGFSVLVLGLTLSLGLATLVHMMARRATERRRSVERLAKLSRQVLVAQEAERSRLSRELHDELGQLLTALRLDLDWLGRAGGHADALSSTLGLVEKATDELRRVCRGLRPPLLDDLGLEPAVRALAEEFTDRTGIAVTASYDLNEQTPIPAETALCTYRIVQEALNNVSRHANARSVHLSVSTLNGELIATVTDDGHGFEEGHGSGVGLEGMRERAHLARGALTIDSALGSGTRVALRAPLEGLPKERA